MAVGDDAVAAGLPIVNGATTQRSDVDLEINRTRDQLVQRVFPVSQGGTGETTAADARAALGITPANISAIENDGAYWTRLGWNGTRLQYDVPGYVFDTEIPNMSEFLALKARIDAAGIP